jgi:hypothetical protein
MHVRTRAGTRIEETARTVDQIEQMIRQIIPANQVQLMVDNMGIPYSGINMSYNTTGTNRGENGANRQPRFRETGFDGRG